MDSLSPNYHQIVYQFRLEATKSANVMVHTVDLKAKPVCLNVSITITEYGHLPPSARHYKFTHKDLLRN